MASEITETLQEAPPTAPTPKSKRQVSLSLDDKIAILDRVREAGDTKPSKLASQLGLPRSTLQRLLKEENNIREQAILYPSQGARAAKRIRVGKAPKVEASLLEWYRAAVETGQSITGPIMINKARELARAMGDLEFEPTSGWFGRWKTRHGVMMKRPGKNQGDDQPKPILPLRLRQLMREYEPRNVFSVEETGLYYRATPDGSLTFKESALNGCRKAKARVTVLVCANMAGDEKKKLIVVGKNSKSGSFAQLKSLSTLPVHYKVNKSAWITESIFEQWIRNWDQELIRQNRKALLFLKSTPVHQKFDDLAAIHMEFLTSENSSTFQSPIEHGVIRSLKLHYRKLICSRIVQLVDSSAISRYASAPEVVSKITLLDAVTLLDEAWSNVKKPVIFNAFIRSGVSSGPLLIEPEEDLSASFVDMDASLQTYAPEGELDHVVAQHIMLANYNGAPPVEASDDEDEEDPLGMQTADMMRAHLQAEMFFRLRGEFALASKAKELYQAVKEHDGTSGSAFTQSNNHTSNNSNSANYNHPTSGYHNTSGYHYYGYN